MLSLSFSWCPSSSFLNCYSAGAGNSGWCLHTHTYHNAVIAMLIIKDFCCTPITNFQPCNPLPVNCNQPWDTPPSLQLPPARAPAIITIPFFPAGTPLSIIKHTWNKRKGKANGVLSNPCIWALLALCVKSPRFAVTCRWCLQHLHTNQVCIWY